MARARVLIAEPDGLDAEALAYLRRVADVEVTGVERGGIGAAMRDFDAVWLRLAHRITAEVLEGARARVLATATTGTDHLDLVACAARGIRVVSLKGEVEFLRSVRATAELTLGLMLALLRHLPAAVRHVQDGRWDRTRFRGRELGELTVGLVGVGRLGTMVAELCRAFGARVIGWDPRPDYPHAVCPRAASLYALLAEADLVSLHVGYDDSTHGLIDPAALAAMKHGAYLVNTSRGGLIDETALRASLLAGRLAGVALDVLVGEPEISDAHPLVALAALDDRLLIVPHLGGNTVESFAKTERFLAIKLVAALAAEGFAG